MAVDLKNLVLAARDTVQYPRAGARAVIDMGLPMAIGGLALTLMAVGSAVLAALMYAAFPLPDDPTAPTLAVLQQVLSNPLQLALVQLIILGVGAWLVYRVGKGFGGAGRLSDAVALMAWLEFILLLLQVAQTLSMAFSPDLSQAIGLFGFVVFLWLLSNFTAELHGFASVFSTFLGIVGSVLVLSFTAAVLLALIIGGRVS